MKSQTIFALLVATILVGSMSSLYAGAPLSQRDCVRQLCVQLRGCAQGQAPGGVDSKSVENKDNVSKKDSEDTQGILMSCRTFAYYDYLDCTGQGDIRDSKTVEIKKDDVKIAPVPSEQ